jgi:phosphoribosylaminoimidazole-succinocarboxamide synthase
MPAVERGRKLYEGKWKVLFETEDPARVILRFKDVPAFDRTAVRPKLPRRGAMKARIAATLFGLLQQRGIYYKLYQLQYKDQEISVSRER